MSRARPQWLRFLFGSLENRQRANGVPKLKKRTAPSPGSQGAGAVAVAPAQPRPGRSGLRQRAAGAADLPEPLARGG